MTSELNIAIIPARGGSKRIPRKNVRSFRGKPLIAWSIEAARATGLFERVIVSTDDDEIAEVAGRYGAQVPFRRPAALSDDQTATVPVIQHAIAWCREAGLQPANICCIYATAPLIQPTALSAAYRRLLEEDVQGYVFSAASFGFPIQRAFRIRSDGRVQMIDPHMYAMRSQDLEPAYQDAGQFYWGRADTFAAGKIFFAEDSVAHLLPRHLVQDIDTPEDWRRAELLHELLQRNGEIAG